MVRYAVAYRKKRADRSIRQLRVNEIQILRKQVCCDTNFSFSGETEWCSDQRIQDIHV